MAIMIVLAPEQRMFFLGQAMTQAVSYYDQVSDGLKELLEPHEIVNRSDAKPVKVTKAAIEFAISTFRIAASACFAAISICGGRGSRDHRLSTLRAMYRIVILDNGPYRRGLKSRSPDQPRRRLRQPMEQSGLGIYSGLGRTGHSLCRKMGLNF